MAKSFMQTTYDNVDEIKKQIQLANLDKSDAVVKMKSLVSEQQIQTIDLDKTEEMTLDVTMRDALISSSVLSRDRPTGYIISSDQKGLVEKLQTLGLELTMLSEPQELLVERYIIEDYYEQPEKYEGSKLQKVTTQVIQETIEMGAGTWVLLLNQPKANLAIEVLEPEAPNSFVSFGLIKTASGEELPTYRLLGNYLAKKP